MSVRDLIPWNRTSDFVPSTPRQRDPIVALQRQMNRLFDETFQNFGLREGFADGGAWPSLEVDETDREIRVSAELPGMEEKDVDVMLANGVLSIRGERKSQTLDEDRRYSEIRYGHFERRIPVSAEIEEDEVEASFDRGVLTVTLPKSENARSNVKHIPVASG